MKAYRAAQCTTPRMIAVAALHRVLNAQICLRSVNRRTFSRPQRDVAFQTGMCSVVAWSALCRSRQTAIPEASLQGYAHKIMWHDTLISVDRHAMPYADFLAELGKAGLSVRAFAELIGMNPNSISNYARSGELPTHLAMIAVLVVGINELGGDYRQIMSKVALTRKKPRGGARQGHFGGDRQSSLGLAP